MGHRGIAKDCECGADRLAVAKGQRSCAATSAASMTASSVSAGRVRRLAVRHRRARRGVLSTRPVSLREPTRAMTSEPAWASVVSRQELSPVRRLRAKTPTVPRHSAWTSTRFCRKVGLCSTTTVPSTTPTADSMSRAVTSQAPRRSERTADPAASSMAKPAATFFASLRCGSTERVHSSRPVRVASVFDLTGSSRSRNPGLASMPSRAERYRARAPRAAEPRVFRFPWDRRRTMRSS